MIKKFKEFFNEKFIGHGQCIENMDKILPPYEIDDQFLKLEEIFDLDVRWNYSPNSPRINITIMPKFDTRDNSKENLEKIRYEISEIKLRMEGMFPVEITVRDFDTRLEKSEIGTGFAVTIDIKKT